MTWDRIRAAKEKFERLLMEKAHVIGVGIGKKVVAGEETEEPAVIVFVEKKLPEPQLKKKDVIPKTLDEVKTDVIETGRLKAQTGMAGGRSRTDRWRPAPGGVSVGHVRITAGTLGGVVRQGKRRFLISNNHVLANCFDDQTEVLTEDGFRMFRDLEGHERLATLNRITKALEYQKPLDLQRQRYKGPMIRLASKSTDLCVTPNHRVLATRVYKSGLPPHLPPRPLQFFAAQHILDDMDRHRSVSYELTSQAEWHCAIPADIVLPTVHYSRGKDWNLRQPMPIDEWLELFGWYIAEGSAVRNSANGQCFVSIRNTVASALAQISSLAGACGFHPWVCEGAVVINSKQLFAYLAPFGHARDKHLPRTLKELPPEKLRVFLKGYVAGDGHVDRAGQLMLVTASRQLADDLAEICLKCGWSFTTGVKRGSPRGFNPAGVYYTLRTKKRPSLRIRTATVVDYVGEVFCATVPNGTLFVRRNGKTAWSGNSNAARVGDPILQPGPADSGTRDDAIATLERFVEIRFDDSMAGGWGLGRWLRRLAERLGLRPAAAPPRNFVDAAIAKPIRDDLVTDSILELDRAPGIAEAGVGATVRKSGRTTGVTEGRILATDATVEVDYDRNVATFTDQLVAGAMSQGGDSGSLLLDDAGRTVGLLFAGSDRTTVFNRAARVAEALGVEF